VLLADDHGLVRAGLRALLNGLQDVQVVAEAGDGQEALEAAAATEPDVALMDIAMPRLNGFEAASRMTKQHPAIGIIMLSMHANEEYVQESLRAGARGYLLKGADPVELQIALKAVGAGETYLTPSVSTRMVQNFLSGRKPRASGLEQLTSRQREVLQLIAEGRTTKEIAHVLNLSVKTVETHRADIMDRLDIHDVPGLVKFAIRLGLVTVES
jgi:DNA-binding NarL/FixJ family response regulator